MIPVMPSNGIEFPENRLYDKMLEFDIDLLKPVELFIGKPIASYQNNNNIKNYIDFKEKAERDKAYKLRNQLSIFEHFMDYDESLRQFAISLGIGRRKPYECSFDFLLQTAIRDKLDVKDIQSFTMLFELIRSQENKMGAYQIIMGMIPEITYFEKSFVPNISEFFKDDPDSEN